MDKILTIEDSINLKDETSPLYITEDFTMRSEIVDPQKNYVRLIDADTGEVLVDRKENLTVHRGRSFALERLFNYAATSTYVGGSLYRRINLFTIGSGGAPVGDPFTPLVVSPLDLGMVTPVEFRKNTAGDTASILQSVYPNPTTAGGFDYYYYKAFKESDTIWVADRYSNTTYRRLELFVDLLDARNQSINEVGLWFSGYDPVSLIDTFTTPEMYSRVTFPTEAIAGTKRLLIEYYVYA